MAHKVEFINGVLSIFKDSKHNHTAFQFPTWPSGHPWESEEQALEWAEEFIASHLPDAKAFAPMGPGFSRQLK